MIAQKQTKVNNLPLNFVFLSIEKWNLFQAERLDKNVQKMTYFLFLPVENSVETVEKLNEITIFLNNWTIVPVENFLHLMAS